MNVHAQHDEDRSRLEGQIAGAERYAALPRETRKYIESLGEKDIKDLKQAVAITQQIAMAGSITKWLIGLAVGAAALGASIMALLNGWKTWRG